MCGLTMPTRQLHMQFLVMISTKHQYEPRLPPLLLPKPPLRLPLYGAPPRLLPRGKPLFMPRPPRMLPRPPPRTPLALRPNWFELLKPVSVDRVWNYYRRLHMAWLLIDTHTHTHTPEYPLAASRSNKTLTSAPNYLYQFSTHTPGPEFFSPIQLPPDK